MSARVSQLKGEADENVTGDAVATRADGSPVKPSSPLMHLPDRDASQLDR